MSSLLWFRKGLRLHDNPTLIAAIEEGLQLLPVFVLDPWFVANANVGANRWRFLQQTLENLESSLKAIGSRLLVLRGKPEEVFPNFFEEFKVKVILWEDDTEPYAKQRDKEIRRIAEGAGIKVVVKLGHTLYEPERVFKINGNKVPLTYQSMQSIVAKLGAPPQPKDAPSKLPSSCSMKAELLSNIKFSVPSLKELGVDEASLHPCLFPGGETEALRRLDASMAKKSWVRNFEKPKTAPTALEPSTTVLSPYLKFGCLSPRLFYYQLINVYAGAKHSQPPVSLLGQLLWREFFYTVGALTPNFDRMEGNPICKQIPWVKNDKYLDAWKRVRRDGLPLYRRSDDTAETGRLDSSSGKARGRLLPHERRSVAALGGRHEDLRGVSPGRGLVFERRKLDVALRLVLLLPVLPRLLSNQLRQKHGQGRRVHQEVPPSAGSLPFKVHLRAVESALGGPEAGRLCHREGLPSPHRRPRPGAEEEPGPHGQGLQGGQRKT